MTTAPASAEEKKPPGHLERLHDRLVSPGGRVIRYLLVVLIICIAIIGSASGWFTVCEVVRSERDGVTSTCSVPSLTSAGVLAAVMLVLILLWPDLSEFSAFGVTVKRLVLDVKQKVFDNGATAERIDSRTKETQSSVEELQGLVRSETDSFARQLGLIVSSIDDVRGRLVAGLDADRPAPINDWRLHNMTRLNYLMRQLGLTPGDMADRLRRVEEGPRVGWDFPGATDRQKWSGLLAALAVLITATSDRLNSHNQTTEAAPAGARRWEMRELLALARQMLRAIADGVRVEERDIASMVGALWWASDNDLS